MRSPRIRIPGVGARFDPAQLQLALDGGVSHAYAYSPIVTDLKGPAEALEVWFRERAQIEERIKDNKLGMVSGPRYVIQA
jgi:hypothetical protein